MVSWTRGRTIGRGSTATVSLATVNHSGEVLAVKSSNLSQSEFLVKEQEILSKLNCLQIVTYKGCDISNENGKPMYNILLEYAAHGTLADAIQRHDDGLLDEATIKFCTREILLGLSYLHGNGIVHCDIKCQNILVTNNGGLKIADFGCAKRVQPGDQRISGTPIYMAPEVARGEQQGYAADIWALGCVIIQMATGRSSPWCAESSNPVSTLYRIGFSGDMPEIPSRLSSLAQDFLRKCLKRDATERFSTRELLEHEFVKEEQNFLLKSKAFTPTSVLNEELWGEFVEEREAIIHGSCSSSIPNDIIRLLTSEGCSISAESVMLKWESDENWTTVRGNISNSVSISGGEECELDIIIPSDCDLTNTRPIIDEYLCKGNINLVARKCVTEISVEFNKDDRHLIEFKILLTSSIGPRDKGKAAYWVLIMF
ncbi:hypothetical protein ACFE04_002736 [Oxalis oulophora]